MDKLKVITDKIPGKSRSESQPPVNNEPDYDGEFKDQYRKVMSGRKKKKRGSSRGGGMDSDNNEDEWKSTRQELMNQLNERIQFNIYGRLWLDDKIPDSNLTEAQYNFYMECISKKTKKSEKDKINLFHSAVGEKGGAHPPDEFKCVFC